MKMRKIFFFLLATLSLLGAQPQVVTPTLLEFLQEMKISNDGTLPSIVQATRCWVRPLNKERWEVADLPPEQKKIVQKYARTLGLIDEIVPQKTAYDYCFLLGGTVGRMEKRLNYLIHLWNSGARFTHVVLLSGARALDPKAEKIPDGCTTETDAIHYLWEHATLPKGINRDNATFVDLPMRGFVRPNTGDTYRAWLASKPTPGSILLISSQPFCFYQKAVAQATFPQAFEIEAVGEGITLERQNGAVLLDTLAQGLYYYNLRLK
jgi:hypothetical protein